MTQKNHFAYLYVLIACCLMAGASLGLSYYSGGLFYESVANGLHASIGSISVATALELIGMGASALFIPWLMKAIPFKVMLTTGMALEAGATVLMAFAFNPYWLYVCGLLQGIGAGICGMVTISTILNGWFHKGDGAVLSLAFAFGALCAALFAPLLSMSIDALGWRMSYVVKGALIALLLIGPIFMPIESSAQQMGMEPFGFAPQPASGMMPQKKHPLMYVQILVIALLAAFLIGVPQHFSSYAISIGLDLSAGASMIMWAMIGNIVFKLLSGFLADKFNTPLTLCGLTLFGAVGIIGLLVCMKFPNLLALKVLAFALGSVYGLSELSAPLLIQHHFGRKRYTQLYAVINFVTICAAAASIAIVGWLYDRAMSYVWVLWLALLVEAVIAFLLYLMYNNNRIPQSWKESAARIGQAIKEHHEEAARQKEMKAQAAVIDNLGAEEPDSKSAAQPVQAEKTEPMPVQEEPKDSAAANGSTLNETVQSDSTDIDSSKLLNPEVEQTENQQSADDQKPEAEDSAKAETSAVNSDTDKETK